MVSNHITLLTANFPPETGGISSYLYELVRHWLADRTRVVGLPTPGCEAWDAQQEITIDRLPIPSQWSASSAQFKFLAPLYFAHLVRMQRTEFVLCGQAHYTLMVPAWTYSKIFHVRFGVFTHGLDLLRPQGRRYKAIHNALIRNGDVIFANSRQTVRIIEQLGTRPKKVKLVHPGVNVEREVKVDLVQNIRHKHKLEGKKCILTVGRLVERKGHATIIKALPNILKAIPETHYLIVGTGPVESKLKSLTAALGLKAHVTFTGYVPNKELDAYYKICDVFVMVSRQIHEKGDIEGFGIVYLEANLSGKPVVAARTGRVPDAILHEETGLLVEQDNPQETASAIIRILNNPEFAQQLGERGRNRVLQEFSSRNAADKVLAAIEETLSS